MLLPQVLAHGKLPTNMIGPVAFGGVLLGCELPGLILGGGARRLLISCFFPPYKSEGVFFVEMMWSILVHVGMWSSVET